MGHGTPIYLRRDCLSIGAAAMTLLAHLPTQRSCCLQPPTSSARRAERWVARADCLLPHSALQQQLAPHSLLAAPCLCRLRAAAAQCAQQQPRTQQQRPERQQQAAEGTASRRQLLLSGLAAGAALAGGAAGVAPQALAAPNDPLAPDGSTRVVPRAALEEFTQVCVAGEAARGKVARE